MSATKMEVGHGLDGLGAVDLTKPASSKPPAEHAYGSSGLDYLGVDTLQDLEAEERKAKREQALYGLDLLGRGEPVDWSWIKNVIFGGIRLTAAAMEILNDPKEPTPKLQKLLRLLVHLIDLIDKRK